MTMHAVFLKDTLAQVSPLYADEQTAEIDRLKREPADDFEVRAMVPMIHTAQDNTTVTRLVTYQAADGRLHVERVSVYLAEMLNRQGLLVEMGGPDE
jgi:hypothetical protein